MKIYHNPRCSKSRIALGLLEDKGVEPEIVRYLEEPPTFDELKDLVGMLGIDAHDLVRRGEQIYKDEFKGRELDDDGWIQAMVDNPKLIERPIVVTGKKAVVGRPPERVLELL